MIAEVTAGDAALAESAIEAAGRAFPSWRAKPGPERGRLLSALATRMLADIDRLYLDRSIEDAIECAKQCHACMTPLRIH